MEPELENIDSQNDELETFDSPNEEPELEEQEEEEYSEREKQLYARLKKAEKELKEKKEVKPEKKPAAQANGLSTTDIIALSRANIEDDDIDEVLEYAKFKKISVSEALKSSVVKATLSEKSEERKSAQAVYTGGGTRRAGGTVSDDRLLADAQKGIMPDSEADLARLTLIRMKNR